jgi:hypothetical protein
MTTKYVSAATNTNSTDIVGQSTCNNRGAVGNSVFYAVHAEII